MATDDDTDEAPAGKQKLISFDDLVSVPVWLLKRVFWAVAPTPLIIKYQRAYGYALSFVVHKRKSLAKRVRQAYPELSEGEVRRIVRRHIQFLQEYRVVKVWPQRQDFATTPREVEGREYLDEARRRGKGIIMLTMHFGFGRQLKHFPRDLGIPSGTVGKMLDDDGERMTRFGEFFYQRVLRMPRYVRADDNDLPTSLNLRPILNALKRNEAFTLTADGINASQFVEVKLHGQTIPLATGAVSIAKATGATILPSFGVDSEPGCENMKLLVLPPLELERDAAGEVDTQATMENYIRQFEAVARKYPHLYFWRRLKRPWTAEEYAERFLEDMKRQPAVVAGASRAGSR